MLMQPRKRHIGRSKTTPPTRHEQAVAPTISTAQVTNIMSGIVQRRDYFAWGCLRIATVSIGTKSIQINRPAHFVDARLGFRGAATLSSLAAQMQGPCATKDHGALELAGAASAATTSVRQLHQPGGSGGSSTFSPLQPAAITAGCDELLAACHCIIGHSDSVPVPFSITLSASCSRVRL